MYELRFVGPEVNTIVPVSRELKGPGLHCHGSVMPKLSGTEPVLRHPRGSTDNVARLLGVYTQSGRLRFLLLQVGSGQ